MADALQRPVLAPAELARSRAQTLDALKLTLSNPGDVAAMAARRAWWGASPYGASATPESLRRLTRADVQRFHARWVRPAHAVLLLAGDLQADEALALAGRHFGAWSATAAGGAAVPPATAAAPLAAPLVLIDMPGSGQSSVVLSAPFVASDAADRRAGEVANVVLGGGYSARLSQEIRIKRGLTYGVGSALDARRDGGVFRIGAQTKNVSAPELLEVTFAELARAGAESAPADELEARKLSVIGTVSRRFETTEDLAGVLAGLEANGVDVAEVTRIIGRLAAVTPGEVQAFVRAHLPASALSVVVAGEATQFAPALRATYPDLVTIPQADVDLDRPTLVKGAPR